MVKLAPKIDQRTAKDIADQVQELLQQYTGETQELRGTKAALVNIFARFAEIIIERLNQVPDQNFLAFLDLLGASRLPPQPARVPLTFSLAAGTTVDGIVPSGTQVAALPGEGEKDPVIFETERELVVSAAQLESIFVRDPEQDLYSNRSLIITNPVSLGVAVFRGEQPIEHIFYIGHSQLLGFPEIATLKLKINLSKALGETGKVTWQIGTEAKNETDWQDITPTNDGTEGLTQTGDREIQFSNILAIPVTIINSVTNRWLRCRLETPITLADESPTGMVSANELPEIGEIKLEATISSSNLLIETAFTNQLPVDITKDFFPFGEKPQFGATFYLANSLAFAQQNAQVILQIELTNPTSQNNDEEDFPRPVEASENLQLRWEFWNGQVWQELGTAKSGRDTDNQETGFKDTTQGFTKNGQVEFRLAEKSALKTVNGVESFWLRVRILRGNYGTEASYKKVGDSYEFEEATFAPPLISSMTVNYTLTTPEEQPEALLTYNDLVYSPNLIQPLDNQNQIFPQPLIPFNKTETKKPALYLGFTLPSGRTDFPNRKIALFNKMAEVKYLVGTELPNKEKIQLSWKYWNGTKWFKLTVRDATENFTHTGLIEFLPPADFSPKADFNLPPRYWLRVQWLSGDYQVEPRLQRVLFNTTTALQTVTIHNEILGSSNGNEQQEFQTTRQPILAGQLLEVREQEIWLPWHQVKDFYPSTASDRHYLLDHLTGKITFGNGRKGLIPPLGKGNIRMSRYQTGGGTAGNKPAESIVQLKTTVPYVDKVINYQAAAGGAEAETLDSLIERAPHEVRHRQRAVTAQDYEDLAKLASPEVIRAKCVPLANLQANPLDHEPKLPGSVSVIIVPRSEEIKPLPSLELMRRVQDYLETYTEPTVQISVVGSLYVRVDITAEIALTSLEGVSEVAQKVEQKLANFLHPLTGGFDQTGWQFGRQPYKSDLYRLLEGISGVDRVNSLEVKDDIEEPPGAKQTDRFLVYSGNHNISFTFVES